MVDGFGDKGDARLSADLFHDLAADAVQDVVGQRRRDDPAAFDHQETAVRTFHDAAVAHEKGFDRTFFVGLLGRQSVGRKAHGFEIAVGPALVGQQKDG